jgi:hypothetical protein
MGRIRLSPRAPSSDERPLASDLAFAVALVTAAVFFTWEAITSLGWTRQLVPWSYRSASPSALQSVPALVFTVALTLAIMSIFQVRRVTGRLKAALRATRT